MNFNNDSFSGKESACCVYWVVLIVLYAIAVICTQYTGSFLSMYFFEKDWPLVFSFAIALVAIFTRYGVWVTVVAAIATMIFQYFVS